MSRNVGKIFEDEIKRSIPDNVLLCRLPDAAQSFAKSNNLRFSRKSPFDFIIWDSEHRRLYAVEAKTVAGKSISFERDKNDKGVIHWYQSEGLNVWGAYAGVEAGFMIQFRELEKTIFLRVGEYNRLIQMITKKSFRYDELEKYNIHFFHIPQKIARTRYTYDFTALFNQIENEGETNDS